MQGKFETAYTVLKNGFHESPRCRYLMARCAFELNRLDDVESILHGGTFCSTSTPFVYNLLARILRFFNFIFYLKLFKALILEKLEDLMSLLEIVLK